MTKFERRPQEGDWVQVWGQVVSGHPHPEDLSIEFYSHNANFGVDVRADRVVLPEEGPEFASQCTHLYPAMGGMLWRCSKTDQHGGKHTANSGSLTWGKDQTVGYIEEN